MSRGTAVFRIGLGIVAGLVFWAVALGATRLLGGMGAPFPVWAAAVIGLGTAALVQ
ncbi:hypothetical protein [Alsobacter sp. R-9]